jgi:phospholipase C
LRPRIGQSRDFIDTINALQKSKDWRSTAVVIAYDDSDGWYDHQASPIVNSSQSPQDALTAPGSADQARHRWQARRVSAGSQ